MGKMVLTKMNPYLKIIKNNPQTATEDALNAGADPADLARAKAQLGEQAYIGYCQSFVEQATGSGWQGSSASDAWERSQNKIQGLQGMQPGDLIYFNDPNNPDGHVGIADKNNQFVSATDNGIQENDINNWEQETGQSPLGYIPQQVNPYIKIIQGVN